MKSLNFLHFFLCMSQEQHQGVPPAPSLSLPAGPLLDPIPSATEEHADIEVESEVPEGLLFIQPLPVSGRSS